MIKLTIDVSVEGDAELRTMLGEHEGPAGAYGKVNVAATGHQPGAEIVTLEITSESAWAITDYLAGLWEDSEEAVQEIVRAVREGRLHSV